MHYLVAALGPFDPSLLNEGQRDYVLSVEVRFDEGGALSLNSAASQRVTLRI